MKKVLIIAATFCLFLSLLCGCAKEEGFMQATKEFYVNDFANVISDSDEAEMLSNALQLEKATTAQVVVVTVEDLNGVEAWE